MLFDTHCHLNIVVKDTFDRLLTTEEIQSAQEIITNAAQHDVQYILNVGTSLVESINCIQIAKYYTNNFAAIGIHPNDLTTDWKNDIKEIEKLLHHKEQNKIVAIGECGFDRHYPEYNIQRQYDAFHAQVELALEYDCALVVHTRDAREETARALEQYKGQLTRGVIHCFSENNDFAQFSIDLGFYLGIGGTLTYPKNKELRDIFSSVPLESVVLETDAPYLPPQPLRGKKNYPQNVSMIAEYLAQLRTTSRETIAHQTTKNAFNLFQLNAVDIK
ncbi:deoxyribonuclease [Candidatus Dependentiae bacterium Noda2021]|nr:deoxyribonuclease [Candidatus Dependentiae bacterium Noda2021]